MRFVLWSFAFASSLVAQSTPPKLIVDCTARSVITASTTREDLARLFDEKNLADAPVEVGEGMTEPGTVVFPNNPERRLEIVWPHDAQDMAVYFRGKSSWSSSIGIRLGTDIKTAEGLNGGPFTLVGFGWDYSGTVVDWSYPPKQKNANCQFFARFNPKDDLSEEQQKLVTQVLGDRDFSSQHPAMQAINPTVYEIVVIWAKKRR